MNVEEWFKYSNFASRVFLALNEALRGSELSGELIEKIESFFTACQRGKKATLREMCKDPEIAEGVRAYHDVFCPVAGISTNVEDYVVATEMLRHRDKESANLLREFFSEMMQYSSERVRQTTTRRYGLAVA